MGLVSFRSIILSFLVVSVLLNVERTEAVSYTVGDSIGWTVPTNDDFYDDWENNKIFRVGDQLIFNWTGVQNVVQVSEMDYERCTNVTTGVVTTSPAIFNLTIIGDNYFITTIGDQCLRGQKLSIEVDPALPSPPPPATTVSPPSPSVSPAPSTNTRFVVGDAFGWAVPTNDDFYDDWENNKIFRVGDQLIFNWTGVQNVVQVSEIDYERCTNVTTGVITTSPAIFNLTTIGDHYYITTIGDQCLRGQKLSIDVEPALPSATPPPPASTVSPPPPSNPTFGGVRFLVGDALGWTVPTNDDFYDDWENNKIFRVGDQLIFNWTGVQNVVEVTETEYDRCANVTTGVITTSPAIFNLTTIGDHYYICTIGDQCLRGQKLSIEVRAALPSPPPPPPTPVSSSPPASNPTSGSPSPSSNSPGPSSSTTPTLGSSAPPPASASPSFGPIVALSAALPALVIFL